MPRKQFKSHSKNDWNDKTTYGYEGKPVGDQDVKDHISIKSLKDLPHSSYSLKADPYEAALPTSEPYPILNRFNKVVGGTYGGEDNIDGGNVQQYANSQTSKFLSAFDEMRLKINANYRYLPINSIKDRVNIEVLSIQEHAEATLDFDTFFVKIVTTYTTGVNKYLRNYRFIFDTDHWELDGTTVTLANYGITLDAGYTPADDDVIIISGLKTYPGVQMIEEMRKSIAESVSILQSTTFTQMAINRFAVITDLPMGSAKASDVSENGDGSVIAYTNLTDVLYAMSIYYQLFLQDALSVMNWHNSFRLKQGTMIRNAFNREVPNLNAFFGLMNKKAFLSMLDSINLSFEGEYIDTEFMKQMNMLTLMPSRRSNSIVDPVLELQCGFNHPTIFKVIYIDDNGKAVYRDGNLLALFDDANLKFNIPFEGENKDISFWEACDHLRDYMSMEATQRWARKGYVAGEIVDTDNARYNQIKYLFDVIVNCFTTFKPEWSDFRETFDVMVRTGTISWTKGFRPSVIKDTDATLFWNLLTDHIYQFILSGAHELNYDEATKRWRTFSLWNMYSGIPSYDVKSGGAFLTLSFKQFGKGIETAEQYEYIPMLFDTWTDKEGTVKCVALARNGYEAVITQSSTNMNNNIVLSRLVPLLSQSNLEIRVPTVTYANNSSLAVEHFSNLYKTLTQVFGLCRIQSEDQGNFDYSLDPDILSIYQIEINDITNMCITYARSNAPFRGTTSKEGLLGFLSVKDDK